MIAFIQGKIHSFGKDYVIVNHHGMGYRIYMGNPHIASVGEEVVVYTYQHVREDALMLFGFSTMEEHDVFLQLISVKGVGPRTALGMLAACSVTQMITAIEDNDVKFMKGLPGIGAKTASQIVLDLKGKLVQLEHGEEKQNGNEQLKDAMEALKALGYKQNELVGIEKELALESEKTSDQYIRMALVILAKRKGV